MSKTIVSPLPGVFYRRPSPEQEPYVSDGDSIEEGQTIGLVEIMKTFTEVQAESSGILVRFEVEDAAMVNPGDVLATLDEKP